MTAREDSEEKKELNNLNIYQYVTIQRCCSYWLNTCLPVNPWHITFEDLLMNMFVRVAS